MKRYSSISPITGKLSGVCGYHYGSDFITIHFTSGAAYNYTIASCGAYHIQRMKQLADAQRGLNTYVVQHKPPHESKY